MMHEATYLNLRDKLRDRAASDALHREFIRRFVLAVELQINNELGREKAVCSFGRVDPVKGFESGSMNGYGSTMDFAMQVRFHDDKGSQIFEHAVPFKAAFDNKQLVVDCLADGEWVTLTADECLTEEGRKKVANLLEAPMRNAVDAILTKLAAASAPGS
jgi:hypothetical protein